jgi:hypothetical protein
MNYIKLPAIISLPLLETRVGHTKVCKMNLCLKQKVKLANRNLDEVYGWMVPSKSILEYGLGLVNLVRINTQSKHRNTCYTPISVCSSLVI